MNLFFNTTPEDAIKTIDTSRDEAWTKFAEVNVITPEIDAVAYEITRKVFVAGFMAGTQFVLGHVTNEFSKAKTKTNDQSTPKLAV